MWYLVLVLDERLGRCDVRLDHLLDERVEVDLALPAEHALCLRGVAEQESGTHASVKHAKDDEGDGEHVLDFCGTEVPGVDFDNDLAGLGVHALLIDAATSPPDTRQLVDIADAGSYGTHWICMPRRPNDFSTNSRTGWVSPVATT